MIDRFEQTEELYDWLENQVFKPFTIDPIIFDFCRSNSLEGDELVPISNYEILADQSVNVKLDAIELNEEYFQGDCITKDIPKGEVVLSLQFSNVGNTPITTVNSESGNLEIELITSDGIGYMGDVLMFILSLFDFYENFMNSMFAN